MLCEGAIAQGFWPAAYSPQRRCRDFRASLRKSSLTRLACVLAGRAVSGCSQSPCPEPLWAHLIVEASRAAGHDRPGVLYDGADASFLLDEERLASAADRTTITQKP